MLWKGFLDAQSAAERLESSCELTDISTADQTTGVCHTEAIASSPVVGRRANKDPSHGGYRRRKRTSLADSKGGQRLLSGEV